MASIHCSCLGALPGPLPHCPHPPRPEPAYYQNFPFYNGPCPPGPRPHCRHCCRCCCCDPYPPWKPYPPYAPVPETNRCAALLTCGANFSVGADEPVPLEAHLLNPDVFSPEEHGLLIRKAGLYMATCEINLPPQQTVDTTFALCLNGEPIEASDVRVTCSGSASNCCASFQCFVPAQPNSLLTLKPRNDVSVTTSADVKNVFSLSVVRIDS